jgi:hypothetical protein
MLPTGLMHANGIIYTHEGRVMILLAAHARQSTQLGWMDGWMDDGPSK